MYYVLTIWHRDGYHREEKRTEEFCLENSIVYERLDWPSGDVDETYVVKNGCVEPKNDVVMENGTLVTDWTRVVRERPRVILIRNDGDVETGSMIDDKFVHEKRASEDAINQLAPVHWVDVCSQTMNIMTSHHALLVVDRSKRAWLIWYSPYGGYHPAKQIGTTYPVTAGLEVNANVIVLSGPVSWKVQRHRKCSKTVREFFRIFLFSLLQLKVNFPLFHQIAELI